MEYINHYIFLFELDIHIIIIVTYLVLNNIILEIFLEIMYRYKIIIIIKLFLKLINSSVFIMD